MGSMKRIFAVGKALRFFGSLWQSRKSSQTSEQSLGLFPFCFALPLDILPVGALVCLNVFEPARLVPYGVEFLACAASMRSSSCHIDLLFF